MHKLIPITLILLAGCAAPRKPQVGLDDVRVPSSFHPSLGWLDKAPSHYERYLSMFREGYWDCVTRYNEDINYVSKKSDSNANGWLSEIAGYADGYAAAEKDMHRNIKRFGKQTTAEYLKEVWDGGGF